MTGKRFTILYGIDENPFEWDIMDNEKDALICRCNGKPICDLLNELYEENQKLTSFANSLIKKLSISSNRQISNKAEVISLEKENEKLKKEILWWKHRCGEDISKDVGLEDLE